MDATLERLLHRRNSEFNNACIVALTTAAERRYANTKGFGDFATVADELVGMEPCLYCRLYDGCRCAVYNSDYK